MAGQALTRLPHSCGTKEGLVVFGRDDGTVDGFCFSCNTYVRNPYGKEKLSEDLPKPEKKSEEEIKKEIAEIFSYPTVSIPQKKLRQHTLASFGVKVAVSEEDGETPTLICYPYTRKGEFVGWKLKTLTDRKNIWSVGDVSDCDFFGWNRAMEMGASELIVTEGEDDAIAFTRAIELHGDKQYANRIAVVSIPNGVTSAKDVFIRNTKALKMFKKIHLSFDMDEPGRKGVEQVSTIFPNILDIHLPCKDANQCLIEEKGRMLFNSIFQNTGVKNSRLIFGGDIWDEAAVPATWGDLTWPWKHINNETRGIRYGETIYLGAGVKMGLQKPM